MSAFLEALRTRVVLADGAMGTELLARGAPKDGSLAELNMTQPDLVLQVHREFVEAGAELIRTNTFTANRFRMPPERVRQANVEGVRLARRAAGPDRFVAGSVGPLHDVKASDAEKRSAYTEQVGVLAESGCDVVVLETFMDLEDLLLAVPPAAATGLVVVAQTASLGIAKGMVRTKAAGARLVGANCVPALHAKGMLGRMGGRPEGPHSAFPSPSASQFDSVPEGFADAAWILLVEGVRLIGGCCGTTPEHLRALAKRLGR